MRRSIPAFILAMSSAFARPAAAVTVPEHAPLQLHVISDEVNPHGLSAEELTQPGDISAALNRPEMGLNLTGPVQETASDCVDATLDALAEQSVDVVIYFAHRGARDCGGATVQAELTAAFEALLEAGGGIVVFHHGLYEDPQKSDVLQLLGASASGIAWNTSEGQRVFNLAPAHFITGHAISYEGEADLPGGGTVPTGTYPYFDNVPDERYPSLTFLEEPGETRELLFATSSGGTRPLGYALSRAGWQGRVVGYQPGEYQPNALDDLQGPNVQVLINAVLWASGFDPNADGGGGSGNGGSGSAANGGATSGGASTGGGAGGDVLPSGSGGSAAAGGMTGTGGSDEGEGSTAASGGASAAAGGRLGSEGSGGDPNAPNPSAGGAGAGAASPAAGGTLLEPNTPDSSGGCSLAGPISARRSRWLWTLAGALLLGWGFRRRWGLQHRWGLRRRSAQAPLVSAAQARQI